jgi:FMN-dependent oxidoreductase (nitrilotriacetate monooxygenase family)
MKPKMHLAFDLSKTHLEGRWRSPGSWAGTTFPDPSVFEEVVQIAERGGLDMVFFGDGTGLPSTWEGSHAAAARWGVGWPRHDMSPYIAGMARCTKHIGFGLTYSSTFMHPFYVARLLNSLDHITNGRIAFNVVASTRFSDAANYGFDQLMAHDLRYERMEEFIDVCKALWSSVDADAFRWDRKSGLVADPTKIRPINHVGKHFRVRGPLPTVPSPQGAPVLIQAGGSPRGISASAYFADLVFAANSSPSRIAKHRQALDAALVEKGRDPAKVGILSSINVLVEATEAEAKRRQEQLLDLLPEEGIGAYLSDKAGYDFSRLPSKFSPGELNGIIAESGASPVGFVHKLGDKFGHNSLINREDFFECARRDGDVTGYDNTLAGTAAQVADHLEEAFDAADKRSYLVQYRAAGRTRRYTIGLHGAWTPETARKEARILLGRIAHGENPAEERRTDAKAITVKGSN